MSREAHVRFWEGVGVKLPRATHFLVLSERHLRRILTRYFAYYHRARTHLSLDKDAPDAPANRAAGGRQGHPDSRSRWPASSRRPAGGLILHRHQRHRPSISPPRPALLPSDRSPFHPRAPPLSPGQAGRPPGSRRRDCPTLDSLHTASYRS